MHMFSFLFLAVTVYAQNVQTMPVFPTWSQSIKQPFAPNGLLEYSIAQTVYNGVPYLIVIGGSDYQGVNAGTNAGENHRTIVSSNAENWIDIAAVTNLGSKHFAYTASLPGKLIVFGGYSVVWEGLGIQKFYDNSTWSTSDYGYYWTRITQFSNFPGWLVRACTWTANHAIFAIGGYDERTHTLSTNVFRSEDGANTFQIYGPTPLTWVDASCAYLNGQHWVFGGKQTETGAPQSSVFKSNDGIHFQLSHPIPFVARSVPVSIWNNHLFVVGGKGATTQLSDAYVTSDMFTWTKFANASTFTAQATNKFTIHVIGTTLVVTQQLQFSPLSVSIGTLPISCHWEPQPSACTLLMNNTCGEGVQAVCKSMFNITVPKTLCNTPNPTLPSCVVQCPQPTPNPDPTVENSATSLYMSIQAMLFAIGICLIMI